MKKLLAFVLLASTVEAQTTPTPAKITYFAGPPTTFTCSKGALWQDLANSHIWSCDISVDPPVWIDLTQAAISGSSVTFPLLAPNGSEPAPSYSFSVSPDAGLFAEDPNEIRLQAAQSGFLLRMSATRFDVDFEGLSANTDVSFRLRDITANGFLSFTNVATPANIITMTQNSSVPSLTTAVTNGADTATITHESGQFVAFASDGVNYGQLTVAATLSQLSSSDGVNSVVAIAYSNGELRLEASDAVTVTRLENFGTLHLPTSPTCTGIDTGTAAIDTRSSDTAGIFVLSPTGTPGSSGTCTATFSSALGVNGPVCVASPHNVAGSVWDIAATVRIANGLTTTTLAIAWQNAGTALTAGGSYKISYICFGK